MEGFGCNDGIEKSDGNERELGMHSMRIFFLQTQEVNFDENIYR
jgi:hypothetical protein